MGLESSAVTMLGLLQAAFPDLKGRCFFGKKHMSRSVSAPWIVIIPGAGLPDRVTGADSQDRSPAKAVRERWAAGQFWIFGKDYTEAEGWLHECIALVQYHAPGHSDIGNSVFIDEGAGDLAQYGQHFRLPFWIQMNVLEWNPPVDVQITEVQVINVGVSGSLSIPSNPPNE